MKNLRTIILAAGKGVRMKSDSPKVLHPVCGRPMIGYVVDVAKAIGSLKTSVILGHQSSLVKKILPPKTDVIIQKRLLGTADAIKSAQKSFRGYTGDVVILCGDAPLVTKETMRELAAKHRESGASCTVLTACVGNPSGYGRIIRDASGTMIAIREEKDATEEEKAISEINVGAYCFKAKDLFETIKAVELNQRKKEFYLTDIVVLFTEKNLSVETLKTPDASQALGINTREDLATAEAVLRKRILRHFMLEGVTIIDPETTYINADVKIGRDTTIRPFTVIEHDVRIGTRCAVGPFCRIRPHTRIGNDVEIGNFTEVSRTTIGDRTFMKHFSFLGDAVVGRGVNIGAGTVTANFDGLKKSTTHISDGAFIGSDSVLIAPLKIGKRAITGAGSVVTKGKTIPDNSVAVGVPARIIRRKSS